MKLALTLTTLAALSGMIAEGAGVPRPKYLEGVGIHQELNSPVPLQAQFRDEFGHHVTLGSYLTGRPAVLALVYFTCPALCDQILHGEIAAMRQISFRPGRDFDVIAISINPEEKPSQAAEKRLVFASMYRPNESLRGWHFLTGDEKNIHLVANSIGYHYRYDPASKMFFHGAGIMVLTPEGRVARYLYGVYFEPKDLKLALMEASHHQIGSPVDEILLFCCRYDLATGKYTLAVLKLLRVAAAVFLVALMGGLVLLVRRGSFQSSAREGPA